ncbi:sugar phosphate isomerase/epimerase [Pseudohoeflea suaedae]|uniref:Sugar phosphate isomerase/epimerase n=1 Tax=Pseudohoeflea suaedae TaxID=877384 RepID=A0A4R5PMX2_9HYPH|nr:sugar phosphate isomerase/epimerase [Pseudohoeflea suaedae]TDH38372.1 sugar phosphate isomerase/epimerase [Pseudohoeflea suaedae]
MKIGMNMFLWTTHVVREHEDLLRSIKSAGFDGVEIPVFDGDPDHYADLARMLADIGLDCTAVSAMGNPDMNLIGSDVARQNGIEHMRAVLDRTQALGASLICGPLHSTLGHFSGEGPSAQEIERAIATQREIGELAAQRGITVALEALNRFECYLVNTMDGLAALIHQIGHPNIRGMYDTFHANIEEADPTGAIVRNIDVISHIHISENDRGVPGRGNIPWADTYAAIRESGYDGWLTIEAFGRGLPDLAAATKVWRDFAENPEAVYREGYRHIDASMRQAGLR